jgi:hypothetical protein
VLVVRLHANKRTTTKERNSNFSESGGAARMYDSIARSVWSLISIQSWTLPVFSTTSNAIGWIMNKYILKAVLRVIWKCLSKL